MLIIDSFAVETFASNLTYLFLYVCMDLCSLCVSGIQEVHSGMFVFIIIIIIITIIIIRSIFYMFNALINTLIHT